ncbi:MAG: DUF2934 domain-containing protein [Planctomycetota bacterium]|nr:MAG: DUF2934 domain-containing protein [Planctomycetota bacterium]
MPSKQAKSLEIEQLTPVTTPAVEYDVVRELAYFKWEAAGCPCGDGVEFWLAAEAELMNADHQGHVQGESS